MFTDQYNLLVGKELKLNLIKTVNAEDEFDLLPFYYFEILTHQNELVGKISFRIGFNEYTIYNGNIGYEIDQKYRGNNYSLNALKLLKPLIKFHNQHTIFITTNSDNIASNKIAKKANGNLVGKFTVEEDHKFFTGETKIKHVYLIHIDDL
ncbi:GNAT family N-acetyltransferase [Haloplasma contractile]|uniref:Phospholipiddiacylglycerol acyltransferase protein n=1 Tax=Haloplasma contractile SSD-17B TaxID=1033810 RepID=F7Q162_9MOLU|nr:GNAT family N-acetyltransferase [Haloplasma contractile]ERJ11297.1 phospholipiddiacylglycerol acyltransferase protein [Haloplasma contractile SSD-17B]